MGFSPSLKQPDPLRGSTGSHLPDLQEQFLIWYCEFAGGWSTGTGRIALPWFKWNAVGVFGRRKGSVDVLPPVMAEAAAGAIPGHSQLSLCVYWLLDNDTWRQLTLVITTALVEDVLAPHHCSSGFRNKSYSGFKINRMSHFMVICALIKLWVKNSLRITYIYTALSLLDLEAQYSKMIEVLARWLVPFIQWWLLRK